MHLEEIRDVDEKTVDNINQFTDMNPEYWNDKDKPRTIVAHYTRLFGKDVEANLEAITLARMRKRPHQYQSDVVVH